MAFWNKGNFTYEFSQVHNIFEEEITSANDLIYFLTEENQRLLDEGDKGSVVITKIKTSKKGEHIIYVKKVSLPIKNKGYAYFQDELKAFYATKPVAYEPISEEENFVEEMSEEEKFEESDEGFAKVPDLDALTESRVETVTLDSSEVETKEEMTTANTSSIDELIAQKVAEELAKQTAQKDAEIERLKQTLKTLKQTEDSKAKEEIPEAKEVMSDDINHQELASQEDAPVSSHEALRGVKEEKGQGIEIGSPSDIPPVESKLSNPDFVVAETLQMLKTDMEGKLQAFVAQERVKIDKEIKQLDQREDITPRLSGINAQEKLVAIEQVKTQLNYEEEKSRQDELRRHEAELATIKSSYESKRSEAEKQLQNDFEEKLTQEIQAEYARQSEQLERIFKGKLDELQLHQKEMTEGLKNNFAQVLEQFNVGHNQVIQDVKAQKNSNIVIQLPTKTA